MGLAPGEAGEHSTIPPRAACGGNIDCRELVAGATLYLPVTVPGALLYLGDGHAAQGDGEVGGTAIECPMTTDGHARPGHRAAAAVVHAETPAGRITFGFDADLNVAMGDALDAMVTWMQALFTTWTRRRRSRWPAPAWTCGSPRSPTRPGACTRCCCRTGLSVDERGEQ